MQQFDAHWMQKLKKVKLNLLFSEIHFCFLIRNGVFCANWFQSLVLKKLMVVANHHHAAFLFTLTSTVNCSHILIFCSHGRCSHNKGQSKDRCRSVKGREEALGFVSLFPFFFFLVLFFFFSSFSSFGTWHGVFSSVEEKNQCMQLGAPVRYRCKCQGKKEIWTVGDNWL